MIGIISARFGASDAFVGYQNDTPASVVFQASQQVRHEQDGKLPAVMEGCDEWMDAVLLRSQHLLLQMASPDALVRLKDTNLDSSAKELSKVYYTEQHHGSMGKFLSHHLRTVSNVDEGTLIQVCDSFLCIHPSLYCKNKCHFTVCTISNFNTNITHPRK